MTTAQIVFLLIIFLTLLIVEFVVKPPIKKRFGDKSWYGLLLNIIIIVIALLLTGIAYFFTDLHAHIILVNGFTFILQIFGAIFVYELGANIVRTARSLSKGRVNGNGNNDG